VLRLPLDRRLDDNDDEDNDDDDDDGDDDDSASLLHGMASTRRLPPLRRMERPPFPSTMTSMKSTPSLPPPPLPPLPPSPPPPLSLSPVAAALYGFAAAAVDSSIATRRVSASCDAVV
jgi:hypothetical protein